MRHEAWRTGLRRSLVFAPYISAPEDLERQRERIALARELGKPFRVLMAPGVRLPEDAFAGVMDLQVRVCATPEQAAAWLAQCVDEIRTRERGGS